MWNQHYRKSDVESGTMPLLPMMLESPKLPWSFIPKIYSIIAIQLLATIVVTAFFPTTSTGYALKIVLMLILFTTLCPIFYYRQKHLVNYLLLGIFTLSMSFLVGLSCAFTIKKVILEASILTALVLIALIFYTFWAARRGQDFNFLGPFLFSALRVLLVFGLIQVFFPMGMLSIMIYECLIAFIFCGYIVFNIDKLIKSYSSDDYIWASISLYLVIIETSTLFLLFLVHLIEIIVLFSVGTDGF